MRTEEGDSPVRVDPYFDDGRCAIYHGDVLDILLGDGKAGPQHDIVTKLRLPRTVTALVVGASLGVAGALLQGALANPLASPDVIGVTGGAGFGAMLVLVVFPGSATLLPASALLFGLVAAALVDADGRVLLQQRPPGKAMAGLWEFPGGKVESDETPEAALIRELEEELGISTNTACLAPAVFASEPVGGRHMILLLYVCRKWQGIARALHAADLRWVRPIELHALDMPPADRPLIGLLDALL